MGLLPRYDLKPFFISIEKGGAGLNSLLGLMKVYQQESTVNAINSGSVATDTVLASMARPYDIRDTMQMWHLGLKEMGIDPWVRLVDSDFIHVGCAHNNAIWPALYKVGVYKWAEIRGDSTADRGVDIPAGGQWRQKRMISTTWSKCATKP